MCPILNCSFTLLLVSISCTPRAICFLTTENVQKNKNFCFLVLLVHRATLYIYPFLWLYSTNIGLVFICMYILGTYLGLCCHIAIILLNYFSILCTWNDLTKWQFKHFILRHGMWVLNASPIRDLKFNLVIIIWWFLLPFKKK
jgi:hypothetical protein